MPTEASVDAWTSLAEAVVVRISYEGALKNSLDDGCLEALGQHKLAVDLKATMNMVRAYYPKLITGLYPFVQPSSAGKKRAPFNNCLNNQLKQQMIDEYHTQRLQGYFFSVVAFVFRILPVSQRQQLPARGEKEFLDIQ